MLFRKISLTLGYLSALVVCVPADIVWSGSTNLIAYHEIESIDFNQDGLDDLAFINKDAIGDEDIWITPTDGQTVIADDIFSIDQYAISFDAGSSIEATLADSDHVWSGGESLLFYHGSVGGSPNYGGPFGSGYLGVSFNVDGNSHYGWVQMTHNIDAESPEDEYLYVHSWAWESDPDTPIVTGAIPEPATGTLTVIGALALWQVRRSRQRRSHVLLTNPRLSKVSSPPGSW